MAQECCHHHHDLEAGDADGSVISQDLDPLLPKGSGVSTAMRIMQMDCPTEEALIRKKLDGMEQVHAIQFNLMQRVLTVQHTPDGLRAIVGAIRSLGFEPEMAQTDGTLPTSEKNSHPVSTAWPLAIAFLIAVGAEINGWLSGPSWLSLILALVAIALSGIATYKKGLIAILNRNLNINALMSIAVTGAFILGDWPEAAMVMVLFAIAEAIETRSLDHARHSVERLMEVAPEMVCVQQSADHWHDVPATRVQLETMVRVRPGERIGLDGIITAGASEVNQAPITGESALQSKSVDDPVYAGTINGMGELLYRVTAMADDTMLARIIHAVHDAQSRKAPIQRFIDRFAKIYTPIVCLLALAIALIPPLIMGGVWYDWIYKALVLLVIACPCALVISTPVAVVAALGVAARQGILIKGGVYLEQGRRLKWLALDKTGTLTTGQPQLLDILVTQADLSAAACHRVASRMAIRSDHPVSKAIATAVQPPVDDTSQCKPLSLQGFEAVAGSGTRAQIDGQWYYLGSYRWVRDLVSANGAPEDCEATVAALQDQGKTVTALADGTRILALFVVADTVRDTSQQAIRELHELGVRTVMLSGDNLRTAQYIGQQVGIDAVHADLLPHEKLALIEQLISQGTTGMVGDGINDAPALARSDIGFAMGVMGTDTAIETADVALMDDDLRKVPHFIRLSAATYRILVQNISVALGIKVIFLVMAVLGMATMWMAVFADVGASLIVLMNSLRLLRHQ